MFLKCTYSLSSNSAKTPQQMEIRDELKSQGILETIQTQVSPLIPARSHFLVSLDGLRVVFYFFFPDHN